MDASTHLPLCRNLRSESRRFHVSAVDADGGGKNVASLGLVHSADMLRCESVYAERKGIAIQRRASVLPTGERKKDNA
jgi:hypothetical protein